MCFLCFSIAFPCFLYAFQCFLNASRCLFMLFESFSILFVSFPIFVLLDFQEKIEHPFVVSLGQSYHVPEISESPQDVVGNIQELPEHRLSFEPLNAVNLLSANHWGAWRHPAYSRFVGSLNSGCKVQPSFKF